MVLYLVVLVFSCNIDWEGFFCGFFGIEWNIVDYLVEDVLVSLFVDLQLFFDQILVFDEFNVELCNVLIGCCDGLDMFMCLQNEQLFVIVLDDQCEWFCYYYLFVEFFQGWLFWYVDLILLLYVVVCWCEGCDLVDWVIKYVFCVCDYLFVVELLECQGVCLIVGNWVYGIFGMFNGIFVEVICEYLVFQIFYVW